MKISPATLELCQTILGLLAQDDFTADIEEILSLQEELKNTIHKELETQTLPISLQNLTEYARRLRLATQRESADFLLHYPDRCHLLDNLFFSLLGANGQAEEDTLLLQIFGDALELLSSEDFIEKNPEDERFKTAFTTYQERLSQALAANLTQENRIITIKSLMSYMQELASTKKSKENAFFEAHPDRLALLNTLLHSLIEQAQGPLKTSEQLEHPVTPPSIDESKKSKHPPTPLSSMYRYLKRKTNSKNQTVATLTEQREEDHSTETTPALREEAEAEENLFAKDIETAVRAFHFHATEIVLRLSDTKESYRANKQIILFQQLLSRTNQRVELIAAKDAAGLSGIKTFNQHMSLLRGADGTLDIPGQMAWTGWANLNESIIQKWQLAKDSDCFSLRGANLQPVRGRPNWSGLEVDEQTRFDDPKKRMAEIIVDNLPADGMTDDVLMYYVKQTRMKERNLITSEFLLHCLKEIKRSTRPLATKKRHAISLFQTCLPKIEDAQNILHVSKVLIGIQLKQEEKDSHQALRFIREEAANSFYGVLKRMYFCLCLCSSHPIEGNTQTWSTVLGLIKNRLMELNVGKTAAELTTPAGKLYRNVMEEHRNRRMFRLFPAARGRELGRMANQVVSSNTRFRPTPA